MVTNGTHRGTVLADYPAATAPDRGVDALIGSSPTTRPARPWKTWVMALAGLVFVGTGVGIWRVMSAPAAAQYGTAQVRRQTITKSITATGTLQALITVQVGTQASGTIAELYADYNSQVKKDQIVARLDASQYQAQLAQANATPLSSEAAVQSAQNTVLSADAAVESAQANLDRTDAAAIDAQQSYDRTRKMVDAQVAAAMTLPTAESARAQAAAQ